MKRPGWGNVGGTSLRVPARPRRLGRSRTRPGSSVVTGLGARRGGRQFFFSGAVSRPLRLVIGVDVGYNSNFMR